MNKVSLLVPVYGVEQYIEACARSLFEQTYRDIEYVFVDDCSPDRSIDVLQRVVADYPERQAQVAIVRHDHNRGLGAARHTAFAAATGDFLMHVDSDDLLPKEAVALLVGKAEEADIVDGGYAEWADGKTVKTHAPVRDTKVRYLKKILCQNVTSHHIWGRLYRRSLLEEHHIYSVEGIDYNEDYAVVPRALFFARRATVDETVYCYRTDNMASYTHNISEKNLMSFFRSCQLVADFIEREDKDGIYRTQVDTGMVNVYRCAVGGGISLDKVDGICTYRVHHPVARFCIWLLRKGVAVRHVNLLYLSFRRLCVL